MIQAVVWWPQGLALLPVRPVCWVCQVNGKLLLVGANVHISGCLSICALLWAGDQSNVEPASRPKAAEIKSSSARTLMRASTIKNGWMDGTTVYIGLHEQILDTIFLFSLACSNGVILSQRHIITNRVFYEMHFFSEASLPRKEPESTKLYCICLPSVVLWSPTLQASRRLPLVYEISSCQGSVNKHVN